jgi:hypothetical protein
MKPLMGITRTFSFPVPCSVNSLSGSSSPGKRVNFGLMQPLETMRLIIMEAKRQVRTVGIPLVIISSYGQKNCCNDHPALANADGQPKSRPPFVRDNPASTLYQTIPSYGRREELASRFAGSVEGTVVYEAYGLGQSSGDEPGMGPQKDFNGMR